MNPTNRRSVHPGEILREEFLKPLKWSPKKLALKVADAMVERMSNIATEKAGVTEEMAHLLSRVFGTTPEFWMDLQNEYKKELQNKD